MDPTASLNIDMWTTVTTIIKTINAANFSGRKYWVMSRFSNPKTVIEMYVNIDTRGSSNIDSIIADIGILGFSWFFGNFARGDGFAFNASEHKMKVSVIVAVNRIALIIESINVQIVI